MSALQSYAADHNGDLTSLGGWYITDGSITSGLSGYIGKLSQAKQVAVWWATSFSSAQAAVSSSKTAGNSIHSGDVYDGIALGHTCTDLGLSGSDTSSSPDAAVWSLLSNGTFYCVDM